MGNVMLPCCPVAMLPQRRILMLLHPSK